MNPRIKRLLLVGLALLAYLDLAVAVEEEVRRATPNTLQHRTKRLRSTISTLTPCDKYPLYGLVEKLRFELNWKSLVDFYSKNSPGADPKVALRQRKIFFCGGGGTSPTASACSSSSPNNCYLATAAEIREGDQGPWQIYEESDKVVFKRGSNHLFCPAEMTYVEFQKALGPVSQIKTKDGDHRFCQGSERITELPGQVDV
jgi:hypothetical protein